MCVRMLRSVAICAAIIVAATAFSPSGIAPHGLQLKSATCRRTSAATHLSMISNPFGKKPEAQKKPWGNENPYRIFGVNEEAPYEEVERAFKELVEENEGNEKYIMQLEMMKEDIFDQRLRARMSGALKSKVKESPFDAKLQIPVVPWYEKVPFLSNSCKIVKPEKMLAIQISCVMAVIIGFGIASIQLAPSCMAFGTICAVGIIYNRGVKGAAGAEGRQAGGSGSYSAFGKAVVLGLGMGGIGLLLAQAIIATVALPAVLRGDSLVQAFWNVGLWVGALFFQVQDI